MAKAPLIAWHTNYSVLQVMAMLIQFAISRAYHWYNGTYTISLLSLPYQSETIIRKMTKCFLTFFYFLHHLTICCKSILTQRIPFIYILHEHHTCTINVTMTNTAIVQHKIQMKYKCSKKIKSRYSTSVTQIFKAGK